VIEPEASVAGLAQASQSSAEIWPMDPTASSDISDDFIEELNRSACHRAR
jgi:hypothetical protein